ncbi:hypothetical protein B1748_01935 [Paenibacillus sp. MY03]|nr:hypothetical protein B1748_01935 [Paenibacillus sp. MY03]
MGHGNTQNNFSSLADVSIFGKNLIANAGYETRLECFRRYATIFSGTPIVKIDFSVYREGTKSLEISAGFASKTSVSRNSSNITAGKTYRLIQCIKPDGITSNVFVRLKVFDSSGTQLSVLENPMLSGTNNLTLVEKELQAPASAVKMEWIVFLIRAPEPLGLKTELCIN